MIAIETSHLFLKETSDEFSEMINAWENDEEIIFFSEENAFEPQALEETKDMLNNILQKEDMIHLVIINKLSNQPIGYCLLACIDKHHQRAKIGITIGSKSEWGKSYGGEALTGLLNYAFDKLELNRITAEVYSFNERAIKLFEKLGFKQEGRIRENVRKKDIYSDEIVLGLLKKEWKGNI